MLGCLGENTWDSYCRSQYTYGEAFFFIILNLSMAKTQDFLRKEGREIQKILSPESNPYPWRTAAEYSQTQKTTPWSPKSRIN
jgi:hypothetical protein